MEIAVNENSDFIIFENDIVPSNFFLNMQNLVFFIVIKNFFGLTGYAPKNIAKVKNPNCLHTYLFTDHAHGAFDQILKIVNYFFDFIKKNNQIK